jgi:hypothetical protein
VVVLLGVNNFKGKNPYGGITFLPDWDDVALNGRDVRVVFDSDVMLKPQVRRALGWLTERLQRKGANIAAVYLEQKDGKKVGVDDYLRQHTLRDLEGRIEAPRPEPEPAAPVIELLAKSPDVMERPLRVINGRAYAATWLPIRKTIREVKDKNGDIKVLSSP